MSIFSSNSLTPSTSASSSQSSPMSGASSISEDDRYFEDDSEKVPKYPIEFEWPYEGEHVFIVCSYYGWSRYVPMRRKFDDINAAGLTFDDKQKTWVYSHPSKNPFYAQLELPPGHHQYKFIVDGKWYYDMKKPNLTDPLGNINNYVEIPSDTSSSNSSNL